MDFLHTIGSKPAYGDIELGRGADGIVVEVLDHPELVIKDMNHPFRAPRQLSFPYLRWRDPSRGWLAAGRGSDHNASPRTRPWKSYLHSQCASTTGTLFGDKQRFAAEVGEFWMGHEQLCHVDLWAAGRWLTCDDNIAYLPQFCMSVRDTVNWLRSGCDLSLPFPGLSPAESHRRLLAVEDGSREHFWFPHWGPTTDKVSGHVFRIGDRLAITLEFWREAHPVPEERGVVFVAEMPEAEFIDVLVQTLAALGCNR